jgi:hypothetical protein
MAHRHLTSDVILELSLASKERRLTTSSSLSPCRAPDVTVVEAGWGAQETMVCMTACSGSIFECCLSTGHVSLLVDGKPEPGVIVKGGPTGNNGA